MNVNPLYHQTPAKLEEERSWIRRAQQDRRILVRFYEKYHEQIFRYIFKEWTMSIWRLILPLKFL